MTYNLVNNSLYCLDKNDRKQIIQYSNLQQKSIYQLFESPIRYYSIDNETIAYSKLEEGSSDLL